MWSGPLAGRTPAADTFCMTQSGLLAFARDVRSLEDRETALERAVDEVQSATGAAWVAAYTRDGYGGALTRGAAAGDVPFGSPDAVDADDPALVALHEGRTAIDGPKGSALAGTVVLPFLTPDGIAGVLDVGPGTEPYTDAERDALCAVANAVGLALSIADGRALRRELARWRERAELAEAELALVHRALNGSSYGAAASYSDG